jgi:hypothetical protein
MLGSLCQVYVSGNDDGAVVCVVAGAGPVVAGAGPVVAEAGPVVAEAGPVVAEAGPVVAEAGPVVLDDPREPLAAVVLAEVVLEAVVLDGPPAPVDGTVVLGAFVPEGAFVPGGAGVVGTVVLEGAEAVAGRVVVVTWPVAADLGVAPPPQPARTRANAAGTASAARLLTAPRHPELFGSRSVGTGT